MQNVLFLGPARRKAGRGPISRPPLPSITHDNTPPLGRLPKPMFPTTRESTKRGAMRLLWKYIYVIYTHIYISTRVSRRHPFFIVLHCIAPPSFQGKTKNFGNISQAASYHAHGRSPEDVYTPHIPINAATGARPVFMTRQGPGLERTHLLLVLVI